MPRQDTTHNQLKTPLVVEALLEVRFPPSAIPYGFIPGRLYGALENSFPKAEDLPAAQAPLDPNLNQVIRNRFLADDSSRMCQIGVGVITVNHTIYRGFTSFIEDCKIALDAATHIGLISRVDRLGLRYINMAPLDRQWHNIIDFKVRAPDVISSSVIAQEHKWVTQFPGTGLLSTTIAWPTTMGDTNKTAIALDLDHFWEAARVLSVDEVLKWVRSAHENIYQVFKSSLQMPYFSELDGR